MNLLRGILGREALDRLTVRIEKKLGEIPFDAGTAQQTGKSGNPRAEIVASAFLQSNSFVCAQLPEGPACNHGPARRFCIHPCRRTSDAVKLEFSSTWPV